MLQPTSLFFHLPSCKRQLYNPVPSRQLLGYFIAPLFQGISTIWQDVSTRETSFNFCTNSAYSLSKEGSFAKIASSSLYHLIRAVVFLFCAWSVTGIDPLSANPTKWSNTLKHCLSLFDHFVGLAFKGLRKKLICTATFKEYIITIRTI